MLKHPKEQGKSSRYPAWEKLRLVVTTLSKRGAAILTALVPYLRLAGQ